jgi:phenylalanyl-tRNA synthetase beta chain
LQVSLKWLKDYIDLNLSTEELANYLTMAGLEVDSINKLGEGISKVVSGEILEVKPHPNADKLVVCAVNVGQENAPLTIVTGAPNVRPGMKVPVAIVGAKLPDGPQIKKAVFRGIESYGMLCSAQELGIDPTGLPAEESEGIMSLPPSTPLGIPIQEVLGLDDEVLELELTPNRSDCLGMINIAREIGALTSASLKLPKISHEGNNDVIDQMASVEIVDSDLCRRYVARIIKDVKIEPSPLWLQQRLQAAGMRSINNIVDVTNFVMLEMGQPLHAFDYDKLEEHKIIVRRAKENETIVTLDGIQRKLDKDMLIIADATKPVAIAGVMGGFDTEVTSETNTILLESAFFEGASIRKTSRKLGLRSEASSRFEKGINLDGSLEAINRAVDLIEELGAGVAVPGKIDVFPSKPEKVVIKFRPSRANYILGTDISSQQMLKYFKSLSFECVQENNDLFLVTVPSYRRDITLEIDLVEEIARLYGYSNIPTTLPQSTMTQSKKTSIQALEEKVKNTLVGMGMKEIITYSFIGSKSFDKLRLKDSHPWRNCIEIKNPLSDDQNVMRTTLIPGLMEIASKNIHRRQLNLCLFESGNVFIPQGSNHLPLEEPHIAALVTGGLGKAWNTSFEKFDFYYLKGVLEQLFSQLNQGNINFIPTKNYSSFHPGRTAEIVINDEVIGVIGEIHPLVLEEYDVDQKIWLFELNLSPLLSGFSKIKEFEPLPKYPPVERDMAIIVPEQVITSQVDQKIAAVGGKYLIQYHLFDIYRGEQIPKGFKSMAYNMIYQAQDRTLTDKEVSDIHNRIQQELQASFGAKLR